MLVWIPLVVPWVTLGNLGQTSLVLPKTPEEKGHEEPKLVNVCPKRPKDTLGPFWVTIVYRVETVCHGLAGLVEVSWAPNMHFGSPDRSPTLTNPNNPQLQLTLH